MCEFSKTFDTVINTNINNCRVYQVYDTIGCISHNEVNNNYDCDDDDDQNSIIIEYPMNNASTVNKINNSKFDYNTDFVCTRDDDADCNNNIHPTSKKMNNSFCALKKENLFF